MPAVSTEAPTHGQVQQLGTVVTPSLTPAVRRANLAAVVVAEAVLSAECRAAGAPTARWTTQRERAHRHPRRVAAYTQHSSIHSTPVCARLVESGSGVAIQVA